MPTINLQTHISAPTQKVFDLSRDIDFHQKSASHTQEKAIAGRTSGLIELGESVTWEGVHFGFKLKHTSVISEMEAPIYFVDEMSKGLFKYFRHEHHFEEVEDGTLMTDTLHFEAPLGVLGKLVSILVLKGYLRRFLERRNAALKVELENSH
jgi:ligand-binding SRPBCC domain-containing protein